MKPTSQTYRITAPFPVTVQFPKSRHVIDHHPQGGGLGFHQHTEAVEVLEIKNFFNSEPGRISYWRLATATGREALLRAATMGFTVPCPTAAQTILERAVKDGMAERLDRGSA